MKSSIAFFASVLLVQMVLAQDTKPRDMHEMQRSRSMWNFFTEHPLVW
jgi:hypothetical protein